MATLKTNTLTGTSTAGSIAVTAEGNSTTTNLQQGLGKSWINMNGTGTPAARDSFNVSSLTDNATGDYKGQGTPHQGEWTKEHEAGPKCCRVCAPATECKNKNKCFNTLFFRPV